MLKYFFVAIFYFYSFLTYANTSHISVRQIGLTNEDRKVVTEKLLSHPDVLSALHQKKYQIVSSEINERTYSSEINYLFHIYNYTDYKMLRITGTIDFTLSPKIEVVPDDVPASPEEFDESITLLKQNSIFSDALVRGELVPYEPMPTTIATPEFLRGLGGPRIIGVGLSAPNNPDLHEIVGVNLSTLDVIRFAEKAPPTSLATQAVCGLPNARQSVTGKGNAGSAQIEINNDAGVLWNFTVVRPSASSGSKGSGLELRNVYYKGKLVLTRAHTPILNVQYAGNRCGPYRDWAYAENYFNAIGTDQAPGIRLATEPPKTIFDTGIDRGNFRGVAIYQSEEKVTLVTELSAGWYRYASKFELYNDGTIKPYFQFSAVKNSCVCYSHNHHVYWRFDFDVNGTNNSATLSDGESFRPIRLETVQIKNDENQFWRISNSNSQMAYDISPGKDDGLADSYSVADVWFLRYKSNQIDDSEVRSSTRAALNSFINEENITNENLVMWYSGHFMHTHDSASQFIDNTVGPVIKPVREFSFY